MKTFYQNSLDFPLPEHRVKRGSSRDIFHTYMTKGVAFDPVFNMPIMHSENSIPTGIISFSEAMSTKSLDYSNYIHFFENDDQIERFWNSPWRYLPRLSKFSGFIATDYSTGTDLPDPIRRWNVYRNQLTGAWLQTLGFHVLCNVRCPATGSDYFLTGAPRNSIIAIGEIGCVKNCQDRNRFLGGLIRAIHELHPTGLVVVGKDSYGVFDYAKKNNIPLHFFSGTTERYYRGDTNV
ncbi:DUF4417 domain-containing protein [Alloscardovia macacae]|uniref:DUF4417 domain-containing protein n=1 Tax=Alloscardovia macacae TaxID=1160091 RepID=A0A261F6K3_9BIFI|nr:DUF4417 domain-containing protein [Alloscardovia macacae]OZG54760.1 hypothetical protein ALMA_0085 [Alloscardovia macacae]